MNWELDFFPCFPWVVEGSNLMGGIYFGLGIMVSDSVNQSVVCVQLGNGYCIHQVVPRLAHLHIEWHDNRRFMKDQRMKWKTQQYQHFSYQSPQRKGYLVDKLSIYRNFRRDCSLGLKNLAQPGPPFVASPSRTQPYDFRKKRQRPIILLFGR